VVLHGPPMTSTRGLLTLGLSRRRRQALDCHGEGRRSSPSSSCGLAQLGVTGYVWGFLGCWVFKTAKRRLRVVGCYGLQALIPKREFSILKLKCHTY
jgi:hypothetical protein